MAGARRIAFQIYRVLVALLAAACIVQIFLAGRGAFGLASSGGSSFNAHKDFAPVIEVLAILVFVCALVIWNTRLVAFTFVLTLLASVVQHATATHKHPWVGGIHPVSGVAIFVISAYLAHSAWAGRDKALEAPALADG